MVPGPNGPYTTAGWGGRGARIDAAQSQGRARAVGEEAHGVWRLELGARSLTKRWGDQETFSVGEWKSERGWQRGRGGRGRAKGSGRRRGDETGASGWRRTQAAAGSQAKRTSGAEIASLTRCFTHVGKGKGAGGLVGEKKKAEQGRKERCKVRLAKG